MRVSPIWSPRAAPVVSPRPPDQANGDPLTFFLYHIGRDPALVSALPPRPETAPHFAPMSLILNYQLAAHSVSDDIAGEEEAQLAMSAAVLALYEHPHITQSTDVGGVPILSAVGITDPQLVLRVGMQPVGQAEAVGFWTPGESAARLAVYYQVAAQLEPVPVTRIGPRVLGFGLSVFAAGEPQLFASESRITMTRPGADPEEIVLRPAETPYGGRVTFIGGSLEGDRAELEIDQDLWAEPVIVGAEWGVATAAGEISASVAESASGVDVPPGVYRARARITRTRQDAGGAPRDFVFVSNPVAFFVTPSADAASGPAAGIYTVTGRGFAHPGFAVTDTALTLLGQPLAPAAGPNPGVGEYVVDSATQFRFQPADEAPRGTPLPLRFIARGASAPPLWVTLS